MSDLIFVNGGFLVLPEDFYIPWREDSPLFAEDNIPGSWTLPFNVPNDAGGINARLLEYPLNPNVVARVKQRVYDSFIFMGGVWKRGCKLKTMDGSERGFEISVYNDLLAIDKTLKEKSIKDLFPDRFEILGAPEIRIKFYGTGGGSGFDQFRINKYEYPGIAWNTDINTTLNDIADIVNADTANNGVTMEVSGDTFEIIQNAPGPKCIIDYSAVTAFELGPFSIVLDNETDWLLDYQDLLNNALQGLTGVDYSPETIGCFPTIYNKGLYGINEKGNPERNPEYSGFINYTEIDGGLQYMLNFKTGEALDGNKYTISPQLFQKMVFDEIMSLAKTTVDGDFIKLEDWKKIIFYNNRILDCVFRAQYSSDVYLTFYNSFLIADHLPDMTVSEYLNNVISKFCLAPLFNSEDKILYLIQKSPAVKFSKSIDYTNMPYAGEIIYRYEKAITGLRFTQNNDGDDLYIEEKTYIEQHADYVVEDGSKEIPCDIATVSVDTIFRFEDPTRNFKIPVVNQMGSGLEYGIEINDFTPRFLIFRGLNQDSSDFDYPYATNDDENADGPIADALSLLPEDLYANCWKDYAELTVFGIPFRVTFALFIANLIQVDWFERYLFSQSFSFIEKYEIVRKQEDQYLVTMDLRRKAPGSGIELAYLDIPE